MVTNVHQLTVEEHERQLMVHGAGIQVAVIRELSSRITACLECGNSSQMPIEMWTACMCVCVSVMLSAPAVVVHGLVKVAVICC